MNGLSLSLGLGTDADGARQRGQSTPVVLQHELVVHRMKWEHEHTAQLVEPERLVAEPSAPHELERRHAANPVDDLLPLRWCQSRQRFNGPWISPQVLNESS